MRNQPASQPSLRVLHLEDNAADGELIGALLQDEWPGCEITRVETRDAFESAIRRGLYDVILSDFSLPSFDGLTALQVARRLDSATPFIFISGTIGEDHAVKALHQGATDYVIKDRPARLIPAVRRALEEVRAHRSRREAEEKLNQIQDMFAQLAEKSGDVFWFAGIDPDRVLYVSPAVETVWGLRQEDFYTSPRRWEESIHPEDRARVHAAYEACATGATSRYDEEYRVVRPDGSVRWVMDTGTPVNDESGRLVRMSGIVKDITERKMVEQHMREQADLLDKARDAIVVCDIARRVVFWNKGAERIIGWAAGEAVGRRREELFGAEAFRNFDGPGKGAPEDEWHGEVRLHNRAGAPLVLDSRVTVIRDKSGHPVSHLIIGTDVTEQQKLEKQYLRAQRLESIGTLAGGIAHDLNNVLAPVMMAVNLLQTKVKDVEIRRLLGVLETSAQHGANLVQQILAFARDTGGNRTETRLHDAVKEVVTLLGQTLPRSIRLEVELSDDLPAVVADPTQIGQVLMNLCVNARDAMPDGGKLGIRAQSVLVSESQARANPGARAGAHVLLEVEDTGTGIPPEIIDRVFDPFFTTKGAGKGTGLGLATVLGIVQSHGGFLHVQSEVGRGTVFSLYFPSVNTASRPTARTVAAPTRSGAGETILLIEDEAGVRAVTQALLEAHGFRTIVAEEGRRGVALFREHRAVVRAVVTDMMMPGIQGADVVRELRAIDPDVRIVAMSGVLGERSGVEESPGKLAFLQKPMTGEDLLRAIARVMPATAGAPPVTGP